MVVNNRNDQNVWLVYDGECPICRPTANALKIREAVGTLHLVNAREPHPILEEIKKAGLDIDTGMVVKFKNTLYHGADAQHVLAMIGTQHGWINRINVTLFRSKYLAYVCYPIMRTIRNGLLWFKGIPKINHPEKKQ
jgi:predicted DCC family thiol-disulfide oxidoreductase YuxK